MEEFNDIANEHFDNTGEYFIYELINVPDFLKKCENLHNLEQYDVYIKINFLPFLFNCGELYKIVKHHYIITPSKNHEKYKKYIEQNLQVCLSYGLGKSSMRDGTELFIMALGVDYMKILLKTLKYVIYLIFSGDNSYDFNGHIIFSSYMNYLQDFISKKVPKIPVMCSNPVCSKSECSYEKGGILDTGIPIREIKFLLCKGCKKMYYCSRECQISDRQNHTLLCKNIIHKKECLYCIQCTHPCIICDKCNKLHCNDRICRRRHCKSL